MAGTEAEVPVTNPTTGEIRMVPREGVAAFQQQTGWHVATADQREVAAENLESGSAGQQALAAGEEAVRTGTLGIAPGFEGWQQREKVLRRESPVISAVAQGAGAIAPTLATGGIAGGIAGGLGLGARGAAAAAAVGEGLAGGLSDEVEQARYETRDVSLGNVMLYGLGGELVGRALPHAFSMGAGRIKRALTGAEAAAGEGLTDALVGAEERAVRSQADVATELPKGSPERLEALRATAPQQYDRMAAEAATDLDQIASLSAQMGDTSRGGKVISRIKETLAEETPAQVDFFTSLKDGLSRAKNELRMPVERPPPSLDEYLSTFKDEAARQTASDAITDEVLARAKKQGISLDPGVAPGADAAAAEYARDATLRRIRGVADHTRSAELDALAGQIPDRSDVMRAVPDEVKLRINRKVGSAKLDEVVGWAKDADALKTAMGFEAGLGRAAKTEFTAAEADVMAKLQRDVLAERAPPAKGLRDQSGLKGFGKRVDAVIDAGLRKLDKTADTAEQYLIARDIKKELQQVSSELGELPGHKRGVLFDEARQKLDDTWQSVSEGLKDRSLFGAAADIEADVSGPYTEKVLRSKQSIGGELTKGGQFDPAKLRGFLKGDALDRKLTQGQLEQMLDGAEELATAHERHGTWKPDQIKQLRDAVARVREKAPLADELQAARATPAPKGAPRAEKTLAEQAVERVKGYAVGRAAGAAGAAAGGMIGGPVGAALGWGVGELASSVGQRLVGIDAAARNATKQAARNLAGVGLGYAQRVAGDVSRGSMGGALAAGAMTAIARFQGDYPDAQASFDAKRKVLDQHALQPEVLYETLANSLGDLPRVRPDLFQAIAQRTGEKVRFIRDNLPPGLKSSLLHPNGTPPSQSDLRDVATVWNTVMDPETVLHDINAGCATQQQMAILKKSDRELYDQIRGDIIEMVGTHYKDVPTSTKASLDLLLGADGLAGPIFSSAAARYIGDATKQAAAQGQRPPPGPPPKAPPSATPAGINAIQTSVTNRQAA